MMKPGGATFWASKLGSLYYGPAHTHTHTRVQAHVHKHTHTEKEREHNIFLGYRTQVATVCLEVHVSSFKIKSALGEIAPLITPGAIVIVFLLLIKTKEICIQQCGKKKKIKGHILLSYRECNDVT